MFGWGKKKSASEPASGPAITKIELVSGQLAVNIFQHELSTVGGKIACHTYVTEGFPNLRHPEVSITLLQEAIPYPSQEPIQFFVTLANFAQQGRIIRAGAFTQFGARKFFGRHLAYIDAPTLDGLPLPAGTLAAISVTEDELKVTQSQGILRVMSRLGEQARYYPCPPWIDPRRQGIEFGTTLQHSLLEKMGRIQAQQMCVMQTNHELTLRTSPELRPQLAEVFKQLGDDQPIAMLTGLDAEADGCIVWRPGQTESTAITPPNSQGKRLAGCFIIFVSEQSESGGKMIEDGFGIFLKREEWRAVRNALTEGTPLQIAGDGELLPLRIE